MRTICLLIIILLISSCKSSESDLLEIDPSTIENKSIALSEIADDIRYIPLDNYYPMGHIAFIKFTPKSIFLYEPRYGLLAFDNDGKKGKRIGDFGRGPGEYSFVLSFAVDENTETIYIMSSDKKIDVYSRSGKFLRNIPLKKYGGNFEDIEVFNSNIFVSEFINVGKAKYNWIIIDTLGNLLSEKKNSVPPFKTNSVGGGGLYKFKNTLSYWNMYSDTIYTILPDFSLKNSITIKPGNFRLPKSYYDGNQLNQFFIPYKVYETSDYVILQYSFHQKITIAMIDRNTKESYTSYFKVGKDGRNFVGGIPNDLDGGIMLIPQYYYEENGQEYLVAIIEALQLKTHLLSTEYKNSTPLYPDKKIDLAKLGEVIKEGDNSILVFVKLKKSKKNKTE